MFSFVCLVETFVDCFDFSLCLSKFEAYISPAKKLSEKGRKSGGVVCLIQKRFCRFFNYIDSNYENIVVFRVDKELFGAERDVLLFNVYVPPINSPYYESGEESNGIRMLERCIEEVLIDQSDCAVIICGDLNARTANFNTVDSIDIYDVRTEVTNRERFSYDYILNDFGRTLLSLCTAFDLAILNGFLNSESGKYTFVSSNGSSVVDYCIVSRDLLPLCLSLRITESVASPHMCLELMVQSKELHSRRLDQNVHASNEIVWNNGCTEMYVNNLCERLCESRMWEYTEQSNFNVNFATETLTCCMIDAADFLERVEVTRRGQRNPWFDKDCVLAKRSVCRQLRRYQRSRADEDRLSYTRHRRAYKSLLRVKKGNYRNFMTDMITSNIQNSGMFWKQIRSLNGRRRVLGDISPEAWFQHFRSVLSTPNSCFSETQRAVIPRRDAQYFDTSILDSPIDASEVSSAISQLKANKAPGADRILSEMIKCSKTYILPYLVKLFNAIYDEAVFPKLWEESVIVPIYKKGDCNDPDNYRGVSLISTFAKVFLHVLGTRLQQWTEENNLIREEQAGFRKGYCTFDNIFVLHSIIQKFMQKHRKLYVSFVDFRKAFDTVDRQVLWNILQGVGISTKMINMLKSMYKSVQCCVRSDQGLSDRFVYTNGLKQGCKLSPLLFSFLMNTLADEICENGKHGVQLFPNKPELFTLLFADDIVLLSDTAMGLQNQLSNLRKTSEKLGLRVNVHKTKIMVFRLGGHLGRHEKWYLGEERLEVVNEYKYLGNIFSTKLCTNTTQCDLADRARAAVMILMKCFRKLGHVTPKIFYKVFDAQVQPILLYGAEIWGLEDCHVIEGVHLSALKHFLNVSSRTPNVMIYGDCGRYPLWINASVRCVRYWMRILKMDKCRLPYQVYNMMLNKSEDCQTWVSKVRGILLRHGFEAIWEAQQVDEERSFISRLKERLVGQFLQEWKTKLGASDRYILYRQIKSAFKVENYLHVLKNKMSRDMYIRFRMGITDLFIHKSRYKKDPESRLCPLCTEREEDENHFLLYCPALYDLQEKYLFVHVPPSTTDPLVHILLNQETEVIRSVSAYLYRAFKRRSDAMEMTKTDGFPAHS